MKTLIHFFISIVITLLITSTQISPAKASPKTQELNYNPAAEEYLKTELLADGEADLAQAFENEDQRAVRAEFIVELFQDPSLQGSAFFKVYNATIQGDIKADGLSIPYNVVFDKCTFNGRIEMSRASIHSFNMYDSLVTGAIRMGRIVIDEDLALYNSTYESAVVLFDANIGGSFFAANSRFNGVKVDEGTAFPFELWQIQVAKTTELRNATIKGDAMFASSQFGVNAVFENAVFEKPANFKDFKVGNLASFKNVVFNDTANFESGTVERDASFSNATFNGGVNFDYLTVERFTDFDGATFNKGFSFTYAEVGWPNFIGSTFNGSVDFTGIQATNDFDFTGAAYNYPEQPFTVSLANVDGPVLFDGFTSPAGLNLEHNQFGDLKIKGKGNQSYALIDLTATKVDGELSLENVNADKFFAEGFTATESTSFKQVNVINTLDMSNASTGYFTMEQFSWPEYPESFNLRGISYTDIGIGDRELTDETWGTLLDMVEESAYSPQAYRTLNQFLMDKGHPDWAAQVEIKQKNRERDQILTPRSGPWFWSWFLYIFSGYGQRPVFAFIWSALVVAIGAFVFRKEEDLVILDTSDAKPPYNPVLYSFALFLPYIDLGIASKWDPKPGRKAAGIYKHVHRLLGWILMPIALLTFGGIIG